MRDTRAGCARAVRRSPAGRGPRATRTCRAGVARCAPRTRPRGPVRGGHQESSSGSQRGARPRARSRPRAVPTPDSHTHWCCAARAVVRAGVPSVARRVMLRRRARAAGFHFRSQGPLLLRVVALVSVQTRNRCRSRRYTLETSLLRLCTVVTVSDSVVTSLSLLLCRYFSVVTSLSLLLRFSVMSLPDP